MAKKRNRLKATGNRNVSNQKDTEKQIIDVETVIKSLIDVETLREDSGFFDGYTERPFNSDIVVKKKGNLDTYDLMRCDDQVKAVSWLKKHTTLSSGWKIEGHPDEDQDNIIKDLTLNLETLDNPVFETALQDMLTYMDYGFSITEPVFKNIDQKFKLIKLKTKAPHTFQEIHQDKFGDITKIQQETGDEPIFVSPKKVIHLIYQPDFSNPFGTSDLQAAYRPWFYKDIVLKFYTIYLERFANPLVIAKVPTTQKKDRAAVDRALNNMSARTTLRLPTGVEVEVIFPPSAQTAFEIALNKFNQMIARSMLIPDLLGMSGKETTGGSHALGQKQFEMFFLTIGSSRKDLERVINHKIIIPLAVANHGITRNFPVWRLNPVSETDKVEYLKLWVDATKGKIYKPTDDEINHFRTQTKFPESNEVERFEEQAKSNPENSDSGKKQEFSKKKVQFTKLSRKPTKFEEHINFQRVDGTLKSLDKEGLDFVVPDFKKIQEGLVTKVIKQKFVEKKDLKGVQGLKLIFLPGLKISFQALIKGAFRAGQVSANEEIEELGLPKVSTFQNDLAEAFQESINDKAFFITGVEDEFILKNVQSILIGEIERGGTTQDAVKKIASLFQNKYILDKNRIETIVRTNINKAFNQGRLKQFGAPELEDFIIGYQFSAILDSRTTDVCTNLDGNQYKANDPFVGRATPPVHFNCRSLWVPIVEGSDPTFSKEVDLDDFPESKDFV